MKILFITHYSGFYGANKSLLQLVLELRANYDAKIVIVVPSKGLFTAELQRVNVEFRIMKFYNWLVPAESLSFFKNPIKRILNQYYFRRIYFSLKKAYTFDLIHTNSSATNLGGYLKNKFHVPHIWHLREYGREDYNMKFYYSPERAHAFLQNNSSKLIAISEDLKDYYVKNISETKIKIIYNGVRNPVSRSQGKSTTELINFSFTGTIIESKNQLEAVQALGEIVNIYNIKNVRLFLIGGGSKSYIKRICDYIEANKLSEFITLLGYRNDVESVLASMHVGIVSSKREAFGRVTVEYMQQGIPVIASNTGANPEIIENNKTGLLYDFGNPKDLAQKMLYLIEHPVRIENLGLKARATVLDKFNSKRNTENIYNTYREILNIIP